MGLMENNEKRLFSWMLHEAFRNANRKVKEFPDVSFEEIEEVLLKIAEEEKFHEADTIIEEGSKGNSIFFIVFGACEGKKEYEANMLIGDEILESSNNKKYSSTVTARKTTKCLKVYVPELFEALSISTQD